MVLWELSPETSSVTFKGLLERLGHSAFTLPILKLPWAVKSTCAWKRPEKNRIYLCTLFCIVLCLPGSQIWMLNWAFHLKMHWCKWARMRRACRLWPGDDYTVKSELLADTTALLLPLFPFIHCRQTIVPLPYCLHKRTNSLYYGCKMFLYKQGRGRTVYDVRDQIAEIYFTLSFLFFPPLGSQWGEAVL